MTAIRDADLCLVRSPLDTPSPMNRVQFRMQRPTKDIKRQFGDFWTNREHDKNPNSTNQEATLGDTISENDCSPVSKNHGQIS